MEALNMVVNVPSWAYDFCYYYLAVAVIVAIYALWGIVKLLMLPGVIKKFVPTMALTLALLLSGGLTVVLTMMQFWVCRSALHPTKEKFAVKCNGTGDCEAVMGTPQTGGCTCGARGLCGSCTMQNNMEPSMPEFGGDFASVAEMFRNPQQTKHY